MRRRGRLNAGGRTSEQAEDERREGLLSGRDVSRRAFQFLRREGRVGTGGQQAVQFTVICILGGIMGLVIGPFRMAVSVPEVRGFDRDVAVGVGAQHQPVGGAKAAAHGHGKREDEDDTGSECHGR